MADAKISQLPVATTPLAGTELMEIVQGGVNKQVATSEVGGGGAVASVNGQTGVVVLDAGDVGADPAGSASTVATNLTNHITDTTDAHDASAISFTPAGNIAATDVQAALEELDSEKASTAYADGKVADAINNGTTTVAPSQNAVFDALALKMDSLITYRTLTASHTLDATDLASINAGDSLNILMNVASANDLTVPPNATQAFPVGTVIAIDQIGAGATTIVAGAGVTIRTSDGLVLANQYSGAYVQKVATNEWYAKGKLKL